MSDNEKHTDRSSLLLEKSFPGVMTSPSEALLWTRVTPKAHADGVKEIRYWGPIDDHQPPSLCIHTRAPAVENRANEACIILIASFFEIPRSHVTLHKGATSRFKIFRLSGIEPLSLYAKVAKVERKGPGFEGMLPGF